MLVDGGETINDLAVLRDQPEVFSPVAPALTVLARRCDAPVG